MCDSYFGLFFCFCDGFILFLCDCILSLFCCSFDFNSIFHGIIELSSVNPENVTESRFVMVAFSGGIQGGLSENREKIGSGRFFANY